MMTDHDKNQPQEQPQEEKREMSQTEAEGAPEEDLEEIGRLKAAADGYSLSINFVVCILFCGGFGYFLDTWFGSQPLLMVVLGFLGFGAGMWQIIKKLG